MNLRRLSSGLGVRDCTSPVLFLIGLEWNTFLQMLEIIHCKNYQVLAGLLTHEASERDDWSDAGEVEEAG